MAQVMPQVMPSMSFVDLLIQGWMNIGVCGKSSYDQCILVLRVLEFHFRCSSFLFAECWSALNGREKIQTHPCFWI